MSIVVRPYRSDDLGQVLRLWESAGDAWPGPEVSMRLLLDPSAVGVVAEDEGRLVGCGLGAVGCGVGWICRTDTVGSDARPELLDALGRFDYVLPVGPPNDEARAAVWGRYVDEITDEPVDVRVLVEASPLFTPADIEWAARKAAQRAFEREHFAGAGSHATTDDFLAAIGETRATLTPALVEEFVADTARFSRA